MSSCSIQNILALRLAARRMSLSECTKGFLNWVRKKAKDPMDIRLSPPALGPPRSDWPAQPATTAHQAVVAPDLHRPAPRYAHIAGGPAQLYLTVMI